MMDMYKKMIAGPRQELAKNMESDFRRFMSAAPNLQSGESFYFGFWPVKIFETASSLEPHEFDFSLKDFVQGLNRSSLLWQEQLRVHRAKSLDWHSIEIEQSIFVTESVLNRRASDVVEGVRDMSPSLGASGWFIYTQLDRNAQKSFVKVTLADLLKAFDLSLLRFLGLPPGWMFNVNASGESSIWQEG